MTGYFPLTQEWCYAISIAKCQKKHLNLLCFGVLAHKSWLGMTPCLQHCLPVPSGKGAWSSSLCHRLPATPAGSLVQQPSWQFMEVVIKPIP